MTKIIILVTGFAVASATVSTQAFVDATFSCQTNLDYRFAIPGQRTEIRQAPMRVSGGLDARGFPWGDVLVEVGNRKIIFHDVRGFAYIGHLRIEGKLNTGEGFTMQFAGVDSPQNSASYTFPPRITNFRATNQILGQGGSETIDKDERKYAVECSFIY